MKTASLLVLLCTVFAVSAWTFYHQNTYEPLVYEPMPEPRYFCAAGLPGDVDGLTKAPPEFNLVQLPFTIASTSPKARKLFNQGLVLAYGFNHDEAERSFRAAAEADPKCGIAWWGVALVMGPNINMPMDTTRLRQANIAVNEAMSRLTFASPKERMLIQAIRSRYPYDSLVSKQQDPFNSAYANEMKKVYAAFPNDADIAVLYAEALMDLHPWNYWGVDGKPLSWTNEILAVLRKAMKLSPDHPGANHLYIHAIEASPNAEQAMASARLLENLVPEAGHLVHMPSHIYIRTGRYHEGSVANERAIAADSLYITRNKVEGIYPMMYYTHNYHFLVATAMLEGNTAKSLQTAYHVQGMADPVVMKQPGMETFQHIYLTPYFILVQLGRWDDILQLPEPDKDLSYPRAIWHYARGMAMVGKQQWQPAMNEWKELEIAAMDTNLKNMTLFGLNPASQLVNVASLNLRAALAAAHKDYTLAETYYREAVSAEDRLKYNEPPDWMYASRRQLGDMLLNIRHYSAARSVFEEDLSRYPANGWSLKGLELAYRGLNRQPQADSVNTAYATAWKWADVQLTGPRMR
jgi:tetratricopeptide (TPR) repeat protein